MRVGIDASNLRAGGGITHLVDVLRAAQPLAHGVETVTVWGGRETLAVLPAASWLHARHEAELDGGLLARLHWQRTALARRLDDARCELLFAPGGSYGGSFRPFVTMSRNLLPFETAEGRRYGMSGMRMKLALLKRVQAATLRRAAGVVFLNDYARACVEDATGPLRGIVRVIPHGVAEEFRAAPRPSRPIAACTIDDPLRLLYVSSVEPYKHHWHVVEAVGQLRAQGLPVALDLIGGGREPWVSQLRDTIARVDPAGAFVRYDGAVPHDALPDRYRRAELFVFASSCENMPNILLEAMACGLPIACAARGPMPAMLGDAGRYFDPERPDDLAAVLRTLIDDADGRADCAQRAFTLADAYSWTRCADETFALLRDALDATVAAGAT